MTQNTENTETEYTPDQLFDQAVEHDAQDRIAKTLLPETGSYLTVPPWTVTAKHFEAQDDGRQARTTFTAFGSATHKHSGKAVMLRFRFSLDARQVEDRRSGNLVYDSASKLAVALTKAYKIAYGEEAKTARDLAEYVTKYPLTLRVVQFDGDEGPMAAVVGITATSH